MHCFTAVLAPFTLVLLFDLSCHRVIRATVSSLSEDIRVEGEEGV